MWATAIDCTCSFPVPTEDTCAPETMLKGCSCIFIKLVTLAHTHHCETIIGVQCQ